MRTALFLSPHLDDVAFSCGGLAATLADRGWRVVMATAFTAGVTPAQGFALACQLDKGLAPDVDYMALRRAEDSVAARLLGVEPRHLGLLEAPNRGYADVRALFGEPRADDPAAEDLSAMLTELLAELRPDLVFAPQALGGHVDHRQTVRAVLASAPERLRAWYRDTPYAIRNPGEAPAAALAAEPETVVPIAAALHRKLAAACAYRSQVGFQFGGPDEAADALRAFALAEGDGAPGERVRLRQPQHLVLA